MPEHDEDVSIGGPEIPAPSQPAAAAPEDDVDVVGVDIPGPSAATMATLEEILAEARLPEDYARICLRADLEAEHNRVVQDLARLLNADGTLIEDDETTLDAVSAQAQAQQLADRMMELKREMAGSMRYFRFRGLSDDALAEFRAQHRPKPERGKDITPAQRHAFNNALVAATAVEPALSVNDMISLRGVLGSLAISELVRVADKVTTRGGVDVPKSPASLVSLAQR